MKKEEIEFITRYLKTSSIPYKYGDTLVLDDGIIATYKHTITPSTWRNHIKLKLDIPVLGIKLNISSWDDGWSKAADLHAAIINVREDYPKEYYEFFNKKRPIPEKMTQNKYDKIYKEREQVYRNKIFLLEQEIIDLKIKIESKNNK